MNSLSWLIYLADVAVAISSACVVFGGLFVIAGAVSSVVKMMTIDDTFHSAEHEAASSFVKLFPIGIFMVFVSLAIPQKQTIMMIAASEFGEDLAQTEEVKNISGKAYLALDKYLSEYIGKE